MNIFLKAIIGSLIAVVLYLALPKQAKEVSTVLSVSVSVMIGFVAFSFLSPVLDFIDQLADIGKVNHEMSKTLLKAVGICLISEFTSNICIDSGNSALAKVIQFMTSAFLLSLSIPFLSQLIELIESLLIKM